MSNSQQPWLIQYRYDPLDQLISRNQSDRPGLHRFYCKKRLATEIQGAIGHSIVQHGDILLAQQQHQDNTHDTTLLATDLQRSVLHTLKANEQPRPIAYSSYGHRRAESGLTSLLGFNGERPDAVTGHYLLGNGYRAFNPVLMRFNSPDSLSPFGKGGLNCYAYCSGDPVNRSDPSGHAVRYSFNRSNRVLYANNKEFRPVKPGFSDAQVRAEVKQLNRLGKAQERASDQLRQRVRDDIESNYVPAEIEEARRYMLERFDPQDRRLPSNLRQQLSEFYAENELAEIFYSKITNKNNGIVYGVIDQLAGGEYPYRVFIDQDLQSFAIAYQKRIAGLQKAIDDLSRKKAQIRESITIW